jgi:hypothetical protein
MTPAASILGPNANPARYLTAVLTLYVDLPDTPLRASFRTSARLAYGVIAAFPFPWLRPLSCWPASAEWPGPLTCRRCHGSVPWPTSNPSLTNSWNTQLPAVILNTYASSYAVYSITPARPKSKNQRFLMIANTWRTIPETTYS